jgi:hypothetical protein
VTRFARMENTISTVDAKIENLKDVPAVIAEWKRYPSLAWMVRHKFKEMTLITAGAILLTLFIGFPGHYVAERLQVAVELLFVKWLGL